MITPDNNNRIVPTKKDTSVTSSEETTKRKPPQGDFEKVADEVDQGTQGNDNELSFMQKNKKKVTPRPSTSGEIPDDDAAAPLLTPFQLVRGQRDNQEENRESPFKDLSDGLEIKDTSLKNKKTLPPFFAIEHPNPIVPNQPISDEVKIDTRYGTLEQPDLASVEPLAYQPVHPLSPIHLQVNSSQVKEVGPPPYASIQEVIDQIVEKVYTLKQAGDTQTIVDLKGPFGGSKLIITESDSAQGQLNITIDNLTGPNQALLEANRAKIIDLLIESGVHVQRFVASTAIESARIDVAADDTQQQQGDRENSKENRDGRRQKFNDRT